MKDTITIKKDDLWMYSTFVLLAILVVGAVVFFMSGSQQTVVQGDNVPIKQTKISLTTGDDAILGSKSAGVTIIEFSDYQCPFCRKFWTETFHSIKKDYIDTGKANLIFRDFPLTSIHPSAVVSAEAAECVREIGGDEAYYKMHDKIFEEGNILDSGNPKGSVTKTAVYGEKELIEWANDIGYDISACISSGKYENEVQNDLKDGSTAGIEGTPGFFVLAEKSKVDKNKLEPYELQQSGRWVVQYVETADGKYAGMRIGGAFPYSSFKQILDAMSN